MSGHSQGEQAESSAPALASGVESRWFDHYGVVASPGGASHLRLEETEFAFTESLDGSRTVEELVDEYGDEAFEWLDILDEEGFLEGSRQVGQQPRFVWTRQGVEVAGFDRTAQRVYDAGGRRLFEPVGATVAALVALAGVAVFIEALGAGRGLRPVAMSALVTVIAIELWEWFAVGVHEMSHALAAKRAGRRVGRVGMGFYWGTLSFYVDASDTMLADRPKRIVQAAAGCAADALLAGIVLIASVAVGPDTTTGELLRMFAVLRYITIALNLVPLLELDGYWVLADILDNPHLRADATAALKDAPRALRDPARRRLALYGAASLLFGTLLLAAGAVAWWSVFGELIGSLFNGSIIDQAVGIYFVLPYLVMAAHLARNAATAIHNRSDDPEPELATA